MQLEGGLARACPQPLVLHRPQADGPVWVSTSALPGVQGHWCTLGGSSLQWCGQGGDLELGVSLRKCAQPSLLSAELETGGGREGSPTPPPHSDGSSGEL